MSVTVGTDGELVSNSKNKAVWPDLATFFLNRCPIGDGFFIGGYESVAFIELRVCEWMTEINR